MALWNRLADAARAQASRPRPPPGDAAAQASAESPRDLLARYLASLLEEGVYPLPTALSDHATTHARLQRERRTLRLVSLLTVTVAGMAVVLLVGRSGLTGGAEARDLLSAAGASPAALRRDRRRRTLSLLLTLVALGLSFLVIGLYIAVRLR